MPAIDLPRPEFADLGRFYGQELEPWLVAQDRRRRLALRCRLLILGGGFSLLAVLAVYMWLKNVEPADYLVLLFPSIGIVLASKIPVSLLAWHTGSFVMRSLAGHFGFAYRARPGFPAIAHFIKLGMLPKHDKYRLTDGIDGTIKSIPFRMAKVDLSERRGSGEDTEYANIYGGILLYIPRSETGRGAVAVRRRPADESGIGKDRGEVSVGDPSFDGAFIVQSDSPETACRLLDGDTRRAFADFVKRPGVWDVRLGITHNCLLLVMQMDHERFDADTMERPLADPNRVQKLAERLTIPFDVIDGFKLKPPTAANDVA